MVSRVGVVRRLRGIDQTVVTDSAGVRGFNQRDGSQKLYRISYLSMTTTLSAFPADFWLSLMARPVASADPAEDP